MEVTCIRQTDLPHTSKLFADLVYNFDQVQDLYPWRPNSLQAISEAARFAFPDEHRVRIVNALTPLNQGNPSLEKLARPGVVAIVPGQQVGLFSGPAYTVYKALTAIKIARELDSLGIPAVPVFWLATEDHDLAEVDHAWVFCSARQPVALRAETQTPDGRSLSG